MIDIIGVGESDVDIFLKIDQLPGKGEKVRAKEIGKLPGGIIGNFCSGVVKHGVSCGIVSVLGDDENGKIALEDYQHRGIDISNLTVKPGQKTFYCVVFIDDSGEKYLTTVDSPLISPALADIDFNYLKTAKFVHMCSMDYNLAAYVTEGLKDSGTKISLDYEAHAQMPGFASWEKVLAGVNTLFVNEDGLKSLFPVCDTEQAVEKLQQCGIETVVLTCAEKGGMIFTREKSYRYHAYRPQKLVDTTGAGDCFNAAFLSSRILGMEIEAGMHYAAAASALSIQKVGARTGMPTHEEIKQFLGANPEMLE